LVWVPNADAEIDTLTGINTKIQAVVDERFKDQLSDVNPAATDTLSKITLTSYAPNKLAYDCQSEAGGVVVFSEIYYEKGWNAFIDGVQVPHFRCNYVLRGMKVPAGKHTIEFRFDPEVVTKGEGISLIASILLYGGIVVVGGLGFLKKRKQQVA
jgi:uncharacterized membrane protein YfhO